MAWAEPKHSKEAVNRAGNMLVRGLNEEFEKWPDTVWTEYGDALDVINNWRGSHGYPLNTFQVNLRNVSRKFEDEPLIAQRIKRLVSIGHKLDRFPSMKLSQMQDLGGCRAILKNVRTVKLVARYYLKKSGIKHSLSSMDDYITQPKASGYRGVHLVYRYYSDKKKQVYNGMKIEMQLRSTYQHAWATAVETVGMFSGQALKSSLGSQEWQRFFSLMGSTIAVREGSQPVPDVPLGRKLLLEELRDYAKRLQVENRLREYGNAVQSIATNEQGAHFYLLQLDPASGNLAITGFAVHEIEEANRKYAEAEKMVKQNPGTDAVLVSVESVNALAKAYPNYFADTRLFTELMIQALEGRSRGIPVSATRALPT
jgi:hypothetical protein